MVALFVVAVFRKSDDSAELELDIEDDGRPINDRYRHEGEENAKNRFMGYNLYKQYDRSKLDENELQEARANRVKEVKIQKLLRGIVAYSFFLFVLCIVSYANRDMNAFNYQNQIRTILKGNTAFDNIKEPNDIWKWAKSVLVPSLKSSANYYNSNPTYLSSYFGDLSSYIVSYPIMRQIRVENSELLQSVKL